MGPHRGAKEVFVSVRLAQPNDETALICLVRAFREALAALRGGAGAADLAAAQAELAEYLEKQFPIYVAEAESGGLAGYLVCRVDGDVVWTESLFVLPEYRRQGIGSALYSAAEDLARSLGGDTPYNWVDPNNTPMIRFLQQRGYTVLNLIELRRPSPGEGLPGQLQVGPFTFLGH